MHSRQGELYRWGNGVVSSQYKNGSVSRKKLRVSLHIFPSMVIPIQSDIFRIKLHLGGGCVSQKYYPGLNLDFIKKVS